MTYIITKYFHNKPKQQLPLVYLALFCIVTGTISALWSYRYYDSNSNTVDYLPQILRTINPNYLPNDFYLNNSTGPASPRFYYDVLMAGLARLMSLPRAYLLMTIFTQIMIALVTALFTRDLFNGSDGAALIAILAVMSVKTFELSFRDNFYYSPLEPSLLVMPLLMVSIWAALRQRPILSGLAAGIAALFHPLMGPEIGGIMLGTLAVEQAAHYLRPLQFPRHVNLAALLGGFSILAAFSIIVIAPTLGLPHFSSTQFIQIYAYFRAPHHLVPSSWPLTDYIQAMVYIIGIAILWRLCFTISARLRDFTNAMLLVCAVLLVLCLGSYIFVELIPTRLWGEIQGFRLLTMFKWFGICLSAGWIGCEMEKSFSIIQVEGNWRRSGLQFITLLTGLFSPWNLLLISVFATLQTFLKAPLLRKTLSNLAVLAGSLAIIIFFPPRLQVYFLVPFYAVMALALFFLRPRWLSAVIVSAMAVIFLVPVLFPAILPRSMNKYILIKPTFSTNDASGELVELGSFAKQSTPKNAIFLVDPSQSLFRLTAQRALVVDFKDFPFSDSTMLEWQQRLFDCYGVPKASGFAGMDEMTDNYAKITDNQIAALHNKYGFSYAVLHHDTKSQYPVIFKTKDYKIVEIK